MKSKAVIQFLRDWRELQHGAIERNGRVKVEYDMQRLPKCFTAWRGAEFGDITAYIRFHPRGEIIRGSVVAPVREQEIQPGMVIGHVPAPFETGVPDDATQAEIWFHNFYQTSARCDAWDSRFGRNYWFDIGGAPPASPAQPVGYRSGALARPEMVNVLEQNAAKINVFPSLPEGGPQQGTDLQTLLKVSAWVRETAFGANAWIDVHIFDGSDKLIHSETLTLTYAGVGPALRYEFSAKVYQGTTATPGSVQPRPEARKIQYRLYYDINFQVFTDGILHQLQLAEDADTSA
ncbi:DUF6209 family protein [Nitrosovibrio tenuis]|uniref:Uncharacterized protein n=1 Tax=Nitrosovibrio tenuis TaxID=1233 RepID=A0A1H7IMM6_9PROT|nr:DUF6209 family protein [Nitrosovibrio tenuis]SEK63574.1 hypothetical protein SAMN05216387_102228 [Nitrosovibrio tenuis]